jgi:hypothetical protein
MAESPHRLNPLFFFVAVREIYFHDMEAGIWGADAVL